MIFFEDASKEHDNFCSSAAMKELRFSTEQLAAESLTSRNCEQFIEEYLEEAEYLRPETKKAIRELLHGIKDNQELAERQWRGSKFHSH